MLEGLERIGTRETQSGPKWEKKHVFPFLIKNDFNCGQLHVT